MKEKITALESSRFKELEQIIKKGLDTFFEVGLALKEIQDKELYRAEYDSFEAYCKSEYGKSYGWAWRMIQASEVQQTLPSVKVPSEAVAREIGKIALPQRRKIVSAALKQGNGKLSAPAIQDAVASVQQPKKEHPKAVAARNAPNDGTGLPIPPEIQEFWKRNEETSYLLGLISKVKCTVEKWDESGDLIGVFTARQQIISKLTSVYEELQCAKSFAVCPNCNGVIFEECQACRGRGSLPQFWWKMVPEEIRKLRE